MFVRCSDLELWGFIRQSEQAKTKLGPLKAAFPSSDLVFFINKEENSWMLLVLSFHIVTPKCIFWQFELQEAINRDSTQKML